MRPGQWQLHPQAALRFLSVSAATAVSAALALRGVELWALLATDLTALAVDVMLVVGIGLLLWQSCRYVQVSAAKRFGGPVVVLAAGLAAG